MVFVMNYVMKIQTVQYKKKKKLKKKNGKIVPLIWVYQSTKVILSSISP